MTMMQTRRRFLTTLSLAGAAGFVRRRRRRRRTERAGDDQRPAGAKIPVICFAPQYVCEELLRAEGFTDIRYVDTPCRCGYRADLARGKVDFAFNFALAVTSPRSIAARRSPSSPACMPAATSCSPSEASAASRT